MMKKQKTVIKKTDITDFCQGTFTGVSWVPDRSENAKVELQEYLSLGLGLGLGH